MLYALARAVDCLLVGDQVASRITVLVIGHVAEISKGEFVAGTERLEMVGW